MNDLVRRGINYRLIPHKLRCNVNIQLLRYGVKKGQEND